MTKLHTLWPTHVLEDYLVLEDEEKQKLIALHDEYYQKYDSSIDILQPRRVGYNFFTDKDPIVKKVAGFAESRIRYMMQIDQFLDPNIYDIELYCNCRRMSKGERERPHNHRDSHYVCVYYLDLDRETRGGPDDKRPKGRLHLQDPNPNGKSMKQSWTMLHSIVPQPGMFLIHQSNILHNSDPYDGESLKRFFVIEARVVDPIKMAQFIKV